MGKIAGDLVMVELNFAIKTQVNFIKTVSETLQ